MEGEWRWGKREMTLPQYRYTVTTRITPALTMGSNESQFNVFNNREGQSHSIVPTNHNLFEEKGEPKRWNRAEVLPLTSLTP